MHGLNQVWRCYLARLSGGTRDYSARLDMNPRPLVVLLTLVQPDTTEK